VRLIDFITRGLNTCTEIILKFFGGVFFLSKTQSKLNIIPLGGLGEIGKNMTVFRYGDDIILVDAGLMFPEDDMLGIDLVIPDITYLLENKDKVKAIFLTHGHEDHIGALPYVMKQIDVPVYGTALTLGILQGRLKENGVSSNACKVIKPGDKIHAGCFKVEFIRVNHSIPDAVALAIHTPVGLIIHTGDFKFDQTPVDGQVTEFNKFAEFGDQGVLALLADSTNAERPGYTQSEKVVGQTFDDEFRYAKHRIIVASFSSNVHRIQQVVDSAIRYKRKVAVIGRSMVNVVNISMELGYLKIPEGVLIDIDETSNYTPDKIVIITTGSQGEPMSALTRMAMSDHKKVDIVPGDTVIISATPIPGNEKLVSRTIDHLYKLGADVIYEKSNGVHVSGHASQEEIKMMHNLVRPKFFIPVHGEYRHLIKHAQLAGSLGMPRENIVVGENGCIIELTANSVGINGRVPSGKVLVDGLGVGDVGNIVLRDRRQLSQDGIMIVVVTIDKNTCTVVSGPDIVSRGFVYVREAEGLMETAKEKVQQALDKCEQSNVSEWSVIKSAVRDSLGRFLYEKTRRRPMILPIIMEI
jgi:ribonuclease J